MADMIESKIAGYPIILPEHRHVFHSERPDWHKAWLDSIHESLKPDDVVIDVGAEQGDLSALVASWVPDGGIVLVEPQPLFWPTIRETFEANGLKPLKAFVAMANDGISETQGWASNNVWPPHARLNLVEFDPGFYHLNEHPETQHLRLDDLVDSLLPELYKPVPIDAILVDVEGAELHVLKGAEATLTDSHPLVWCAIHPEIMRDRYGHDPNDLLVYMRGLGYQVELLGFQGEVHAQFYP